MARFVVLDTGPLGLASNARGKRDVDRCNAWLASLTVARRGPTAGGRSGSRANASRTDTGGSSDSSAPSLPGSRAASVRVVRPLSS